MRYKEHKLDSADLSKQNFARYLPNMGIMFTGARMGPKQQYEAINSIY